VPTLSRHFIGPNYNTMRTRVLLELYNTQFGHEALLPALQSYIRTVTARMPAKLQLSFTLKFKG